MIWFWIIAFIIESCVAIYAFDQRDKYRDSAQTLAAELRDLRRLAAVPPQRPLTPPKAKVQDTPKRYTGSQLRRISEQENAAVWDSLQERPNSEILQEQE